MIPSEDHEPVPLNALPHWRTIGGNNAFHNYFNDFSHISDTNLRRRIALTEIDKAPFGASRTLSPPPSPPPPPPPPPIPSPLLPPSRLTPFR